MNVLTTVRSADGLHATVDITIAEDGSTARTLGPFDPLTALRCARHILLNWRTWLAVLSAPDNALRSEAYHMHVEQLMAEIDLLPFGGTHAEWMSIHPLPTLP